MSNQHVKELKLQELYKFLPTETRIVPVLRMEGAMLDKYGFHAGETVVVTYSKDRLVIRPKLSRSEYRKAVKAAKLF